jgi:hypothetical protein
MSHTPQGALLWRPQGVIFTTGVINDLDLIHWLANTVNRKGSDTI